MAQYEICKINQSRKMGLVEYQIGGPNPSLLYEASAKRLENRVSRETESFARYLRDNLALESLPEIASH